MITSIVTGNKKIPRWNYTNYKRDAFNLSTSHLKSKQMGKRSILSHVRYSPRWKKWSSYSFSSDLFTYKYKSCHSVWADMLKSEIATSPCTITGRLQRQWFKWYFTCIVSCKTILKSVFLKVYWIVISNLKGNCRRPFLLKDKMDLKPPWSHD